MLIAVGCVMLTDAVADAPQASLTISEYVPAVNPVAVSVVPPPGVHE